MFFSPHFWDLLSLRLFIFLCRHQYLQNSKKFVKLKKMSTKVNNPVWVQIAEEGGTATKQ